MPSQLPKHAALPKGSVWPFHDVDKAELLEEACSYQCILDPKGPTSEIKWVTVETGEKESTNMPPRYNELMKRFVWRGDILTALLRSPTYMADIDACTEKAMVNNLRYHLDVSKELRASLHAAAASEEPEPVVRLLEVYMLEEFYVGRHDPSAVIKWQMMHPNINLRCTDVLTVGK